MKSTGEGMLQYSGTAADTNFYNIAKDLSIINARNEEITDREGHLYGYWVKIQTASSASDGLVLAMIPNTWKVRNAFRKFHFAREHMFRESGITKREMGKYGRTLRPYFSNDHRTSGDESPRLYNAGDNTISNATGGEWTYSKLASAPTFTDTTDVEDITLPMADSWNIHVLGSNNVQTTEADGTKTWTSVGMIHSYNQDRMSEIPDATADSAIVSPNNPLAALRSQSVISGEVTEIAEDQELEAPPYDIANAGDSVEAVYDYMLVSGTTGATAQMRSWGTFFVPAGILALTNTETNSNALEIQVVGKELCKDVF